jgi:hypothetical protein
VRSRPELSTFVTRRKLLSHLAPQTSRNGTSTSSPARIWRKHLLLRSQKMHMACERIKFNRACRAATFSGQMRALCGTTSGHLWTSGCAKWVTTTCRRQLFISISKFDTPRYFPLLIPLSFFGKEAAHVQGFAKECAVVTHHRLRASADQGGTSACRGVCDANGCAGVEVDPEAQLRVIDSPPSSLAYITTT